MICDKESYKQATISREVRDFLQSDLLGRKKGLGELHPQTISSQYQLALYYLDSGDETEGLARLIELSKILKKSDFQSTRSIEILTRLADCLEKQAGDSTKLRD